MSGVSLTCCVWFLLISEPWVGAVAPVSINHTKKDLRSQPLNLPKYSTGSLQNYDVSPTPTFSGRTYAKATCLEAMVKRCFYRTSWFGGRAVAIMVLSIHLCISHFNSCVYFIHRWHQRSKVAHSSNGAWAKKNSKQWHCEDRILLEENGANVSPQIPLNWMPCSNYGAEENIGRSFPFLIHFSG